MPSGIYLTFCNHKSTLAVQCLGGGGGGGGWLNLAERDLKRSNLTFRFEPLFANTSPIRLHSWVNPIPRTGKR